MCSFAALPKSWTATGLGSKPRWLAIVSTCLSIGFVLSLYCRETTQFMLTTLLFSLQYYTESVSYALLASILCLSSVCMLKFFLYAGTLSITKWDHPKPSLPSNHLLGLISSNCPTDCVDVCVCVQTCMYACVCECACVCGIVVVDLFHVPGIYYD